MARGDTVYTCQSNTYGEGAWLERWLPEGRVFVAVGVGHMYGERGLVSLLRQHGYRVERVEPFELAEPSPAPRQ